MNARQIRMFLLKHPKPATVRVSGDCETQELKPARNAARCAETIEALGVDLIECLDAKGGIIRATRLSEEESRRSDAATLPAGLAADPESLRLAHFADLVHRAYEHSTEIAFTKMVEVFDIMANRSESIEARLERAEARARRLENEQVDDAFERAEEIAEAKEAAAAGGNDLGSQLLGSFLGGRANGAANGAPKGKT